MVSLQMGIMSEEARRTNHHGGKAKTQNKMSTQRIGVSWMVVHLNDRGQFFWPVTICSLENHFFFDKIPNSFSSTGLKLQAASALLPQLQRITWKFTLHTKENFYRICFQTISFTKQYFLQLRSSKLSRELLTSSNSLQLTCLVTRSLSCWHLH